MAITQYTEPATVNPSLTDWQNSIARDNASSRGFAEVDLSSYADGATAPTVAVGSRFDNNGALYVVSGSAESISGIAGISNSTTFYVYYDVSAGVFLASTTAPNFDKEKRGWYNGNDRALFVIYKDASGNYDYRRSIDINNDSKSSTSSTTVSASTNLMFKVIEIGDWNMDSTTTLNVAHGISKEKIRGVSAIIRPDDDGIYYDIYRSQDGGATIAGYISQITDTNIVLVRSLSNFFDQAGFDSTSFNRGWVTITYEG